MEKFKLLEKNGILFNVGDEGTIQILDSSHGKIIKQLKEVEQFSKTGGHFGNRYLFTHGQYVHRLVAEAWIGPIPDRYQVNHIDGNKWNNKLDNLEITTASENIRHAMENGLFSIPVRHKRPVFYVIDIEEKNIVAEFYSEDSMSRFLATIGAELDGAVKKDLINYFPKSKYKITRTL